MSRVIECLFPHVARWVQTHGYTEMKYDNDSRAFVRALASDGMIEKGWSTIPPKTRHYKG
jgi:hypothetical protein